MKKLHELRELSSGEIESVSGGEKSLGALVTAVAVKLVRAVATTTTSSGNQKKWDQTLDGHQQNIK